MKLEEVIIKPVITEKTSQAAAMNRYAFWVDKGANKNQIKRAVEKFFKAQVLKVWTTTRPGKGKKAIVQLAEGDKIELFESGE